MKVEIVKNLTHKFKNLTLFNKTLVIAGLIIFSMSAVGMANPPLVETKTEVRTEEILPGTLEEKDANLLLDKSQIKVKGVSGKQEVTYKVTYKNGKEINKTMQGKPKVVKAAVDEVMLVGTRQVVSEVKNEVIPFAKKTETNAGMDKGTTAVKQAGINGQKTLTYEVTKVEGKEVGRKLSKELVTVNPVDEVVYVGTKTKQAVPKTSSCDPNYSGACVPIASDVDCGGGSGNGPAYVYGTVRVVGSDIYGLDRDGDGYGCD